MRKFVTAAAAAADPRRHGHRQPGLWRTRIMANREPMARRSTATMIMAGGGHGGGLRRRSRCRLRWRRTAAAVVHDRGFDQLGARLGSRRPRL
jgi:hypothetical protein